jgi:6-phosphogluconolactonase
LQTETLPTADAVARRACQRILAAATEAIDRRGAFTLAVAGGTTPETCYKLLAEASADWAHWHIYFGDERCLPPGDPARNSTMVAARLTDRVPIPPRQVHPIPAERGAAVAADAYTATIRTALPFDLVLLGMGEDGHTASLFPGHRHPPDALVVPVHGAPKPPPERVSLGTAALVSCRQLLVLVTGAGKRAALRQWRDGEDLPIACTGGAGNAFLLCDRAASPSQEDAQK